MSTRPVIQLDRERLRDAIVAANIGVDTVLVNRQRKSADDENTGDVWQEVAMQIEKAKNNVVCVIRTPEAKTSDQSGDSLRMDATLTVSLVCLPVFRAAQTPEEDIFHDLLVLLHSMYRNSTEHAQWRYRVTGWGELFDLPPQADYLARQIVLTRPMLFSPRG